MGEKIGGGGVDNSNRFEMFDVPEMSSGRGVETSREGVDKIEKEMVGYEETLVKNERKSQEEMEKELDREQDRKIGLGGSGGWK